MFFHSHHKGRKRYVCVGGGSFDISHPRRGASLVPSGSSGILFADDSIVVVENGAGWLV
jgi:hypothetical protein